MKIRKRKKRSGQAMVEFAFVMGLYLFMIGFMLSGFQLMHAKIVMDIGAYNGARYASLYKSDKVTAKQEAESVLELNSFKDVTTSKVNFKITDNFTTCEVYQDIHLLFPVLDPNTAVTVMSEKQLKTSFTIRNEVIGR